MLTYDISDWLKSGDNLIICRVQPENGQVALLAELVRDLHNGQLSRVGTGSDWQTIVNDVPGLVETKSAHVVGVYGDPPWGVLPQALSANLPSAPTQDLRTILTWLVIIVATLALVFLLWIATSLLGAKISGRPLTQHCNSDALVHLAAVGPALLMLLLAYDVRFDLDWCFTPTITAGLILLLLSAKGLVLLFSRSASEPASVREPQPVNARWRRFWKLAAIGVIMLVGFALRAPNLTAVSLDNDEFGIVQYADGVLTAGYPFITLGSFKKTATTYELVSYSVAASRALFGTNEAAFRFPSLFFGILTIGLIAWVGYRLVDWRVGLVAAVIYAFFPCAVWWSRNAFYPMQEQFLALLTMWCFYEAIRTRPIHRAYLTAASVAFVLAYLSWEGSGFLIPAMFVCMFAMKWGEYDWIGDWHLWRCFFLVTCVVLIQLIHRQFASMPTYLQIGVSIADVSTPELVYLDPTTYDPGFYFRNCLLQENFYVMSLVLFAGIAFCWKHRGIRYLFVMFVSLLICYTEFLPAYAIRYSNNYHTLIILISVAVLFELWDRISSIDIPNEIRALRTLRWEAPAALVLILILSANGYILKTYRLSNNPDVPIIGGRIGVYKTDYRGVARFAASKWSPGDALIVTIPHIFEFYARRDVDYSSSTTFGKVVTYDGGQASPAFIDKFRGRPAVRGVEEIDSLRSRYRRLWVLQVGAADLFDDLTTEYLRQKGRVVYESYRCRIVLVEGTHASAIDIKQKEREINRPSWRVTSD